MSEGQHAVKIVKIRYGSKTTPAFTAKDGSRQMMMIFADAKGHEVTSMLTLSEKAGWTLARLMGAAGVDLAALETDGKGPEDFADPGFAEAILLERTLVVDVRGTGAFPDVTPVRRDPDAPPIVVTVPTKAPAAKPAPAKTATPPKAPAAKPAPAKTATPPADDFPPDDEDGNIPF
jgi:hypothetical protein